MSRTPARIALLLIALGALRLFALALHDPVAGYANQYDMARSSACLGLWPGEAAAPPGVATPAAPIADYRYGGVGGLCYPSTDVALAAAAVGLDAVLDRDGRRDFDLRQLGALKALLLVAIALALDRALRARGKARIAHAAIFALLLADPFNALYLNTLYTEFGALAGAYLALGCMGAMILVETPRRMLVVGLGLGLLALGCSRMQHVALVPMLALVAVLGLRARARPWHGAAIAGAIAIAASLAFALFLQRTQESVADANRINTVLGAVLPASRDPDALATRLGLTPACAELVFATWYRQRGHDLMAECPELRRVSRVAMVAALLREPDTLATMFGRGVALSTAWRIPYVGELGDAQYARVEHGPPNPFASIADRLAPRGFVFHVVLWFAPVLAGVFAWLVLLPASLRSAAPPVSASGDLLPELQPRLDPLIVLLAAGGSVVALTLASAVFGDGYSELARHLHLAQNAALLTWVMLPAVLLRMLERARRGTPTQARLTLRIARTVALASVLAILGLVVALARLPLAYGVLDQPATDGPTAAPVSFSGWAIDPSGVESAEARFDDGTVAPLVLRRDALLSRLMPIGGGRKVMRFEGAAGSRGVAWIVVRNGRGVEAAIDVRRFDVPAGR